ncbi:MAG: hypothetical protein HY280_06570 [Nitrospinae bacterium]|nr:hypothetical protein [Nitrospinota bacterium]
MGRGFLLRLSLAVFSMALASCASDQINIAMKVNHPAEINLKDVKKLAFGDFTGTNGKDLSGMIKNGLTGKGYELMDRTQLDQIMSELKLNYSDLADRNKAVKLGSIMGASVILTGDYRIDYRETEEHSTAPCTADVVLGIFDALNNNKVRDIKQCESSKRVGIATANGNIDIVDVSTGVIVASKHLGAQKTATTEGSGHAAPTVDSNGLRQRCVAESAALFVHLIAPWSETVAMPFRKNSDVPDYEKAINMINVGEIQEGIKMIQAALNASETNPKIDPKTLAVGYWNQGLIYEYALDFDHAVDSFMKGYKITSGPEFAARINRCKQLKEEQKKLKEQTHSMLMLRENFWRTAQNPYFTAMGAPVGLQ